MPGVQGERRVLGDGEPGKGAGEPGPRPLTSHPDLGWPCRAAADQGCGHSVSCEAKGSVSVGIKFSILEVMLECTCPGKKGQSKT